MKSGFRRMLGAYSEVAKQTLNEGTAPEDREEVAQRKAALLQRGAEKRQTSVKAQERIFKLQREKQKVMERLREDLRSVDNPFARAETPPGSRPVVWKNGGLLCEGKPLDVGALLTDGEWGVAYALDPYSVPAHLRKRYALERAKRRLREYADDQIIVDETQSAKATDEWKRQTYERIAEDRKKKENLAAGLLAERMVRCFLTKLSVNHDLDFDVIPVDVQQDVDRKMDFILRRKARTRGVKIESGDHADVMGVQFTLDNTPERLQTKARQVERSRRELQRTGDVDDLVLVSLPMKRVTETYQTWKEKLKSPPGGPDQLWDAATKESVFRTVLNGFYTPEEIEERWRKL